MNSILLVCAATLCARASEPAASAGGPEVKWHAPGAFISGQPYKVNVAVTAPKEGTVIASWLFTPSAFTVDGKPLGRREEGGTFNLPAGFKIEGEVDLSAHLPPGGEFKLGYASELVETPPVTVVGLEPAPEKLDFMTMPVEQLGDYMVLLKTNRGDILVKFWPDVAPNTVRNYLDLSYTKFYDGITFHRVIPGMMIQGGDPTGTGSGDGKRPNLKAEFNNKKHVPGVLSMARRGTPGKSGPDDPLKDTASSQFFVMQAVYPSLDGNYTGFGETVYGLDVVDKIVNSPRGANDKPLQPQVIQQAVVFKKKSG